LSADLPKLQSDLLSIISKIKSTGKWTPVLDAAFERNVPTMRIPPELAQVVKNNGGFRSFIEKLQASLKKLATHIDDHQKELNALKPKAVGSLNQMESLDRFGARVIPVGYATAPPRLRDVLRCVPHAAACVVCTLVAVVVEVATEGGGTAVAVTMARSCVVGACLSAVQCGIDAVNSFIA
jgi:hypothetical protein